jgi:hypothetical protein
MTRSSTRVVLLLLATVVVAGSGIAEAQTTVTLPDTSQTTTLTATVSEQARVMVPAGVAFTVTSVSTATAATSASVTVDRIVLATATKQFRVSLEANALNFTPPSVGATTWAAADVTWNAAAWTNATGSAGTLSNASFTPVAVCTAGVATCSTSALVFTLAAKTTVQISGNHTLTVTWKFESIGS